MNLTSREIVAIILWWGEGSKSRRDIRWKNTWSYPVEITNTNPLIIKIFLDFLRYDLKVDEDRIRLQLQIHLGDDQVILEEFWSELTNISLDKFQKTIVRPTGKKIGKSKGTCKIRFVDKAVYQKLDLLLKQVLIEVQQDPNLLTSL